MLWRVLSFLWPVRLAHHQGAFGPVEIAYEYGVKVLNTPNANQSHGSLHTIWQRVFRQVLSRDEPPGNVLLLGLGGGSVVKILRDERYIGARITAVEADPLMVRIAREQFGLGRYSDVEVIVDDAFRCIRKLAVTFDLVVVDVFIDNKVPEPLARPEIVQRLMELTAEHGHLLINTMVIEPEGTCTSLAIAGAMEHMGATFTVLEPMEGNRVIWWRPVERT